MELLPGGSSSLPVSKNNQTALDRFGWTILMGVNHGDLESTAYKWEGI